MYHHACIAMYVRLYMAMYVWPCMYHHACIAMYVRLCMALFVWLCMYRYVRMYDTDFKGIIFYFGSCGIIL